MSFHGMEPKLQGLIKQVVEGLPAEKPIYLVGGAVRDLLLQRPIHDLDFVLPDNAIHSGRRIANQLGADFYPLDVERDTGRSILNDPALERIRLDFARQRSPDIELDLRDRDFTINAIAIDLHYPDQLLDPCGGARHLLTKELILCSPDSMLNDPVRIIRAVRLSIQLNFTIPPETVKAMRNALPGLPRISPERVRDELFRILDSSGSASAIRLLESIGALVYILPELQSLKRFEQPKPHFFDLWNHTLSSLRKFDDLSQALQPELLEEKSANWALGLVSLRLGRYRMELEAHLSRRLNPDRSLIALLRLAALYHDVGKPLAIQQSEDNRMVFYGHELAGEQIAQARAVALRLSNVEIDRLGAIIRGHMRPLSLAQGDRQPTNRAIYRFFRDLGSAGVDVCLFSLADVLATYGPALPQEVWLRQLDVVRSLLETWWEHPQERISPPALLNGDDLLREFDLKPGPLIGELLELVREAQVAGEISRTEEALALAQWRLDQG